jgi:hypothetical protein
MLQAPRSTLHADHSVIYKKVSTTNPSGGSFYDEILSVTAYSISGGAQGIGLECL